MRLAWKICMIRSEFGVCSADLWKDPIHTPLNLLLLGRAGLVPQGISAPGITWVPSVAGGVPDGDGQRFGTGRRCRNLPTLGAAQCPSVLPGTGTVVFIFFFPIDIVSLQSFYWEISAIKKGKKKEEYLNFPDWSKSNSLWFDCSDSSSVMGDAPMALRLFGVSWVSLKVLWDPPGSPWWFWTSADGCCQEICPSPVALWLLFDWCLLCNKHPPLYFCPQHLGL